MKSKSNLLAGRRLLREASEHLAAKSSPAEFEDEGLDDAVADVFVEGLRTLFKKTMSEWEFTGDHKVKFDGKITVRGNTFEFSVDTPIGKRNYRIKVVGRKDKS